MFGETKIQTQGGKQVIENYYSISFKIVSDLVPHILNLKPQVKTQGYYTLCNYNVLQSGSNTNKNWDEKLIGCDIFRTLDEDKEESHSSSNSLRNKFGESM